MSSTFSLSRLGKLITKQLFENSKLYIFSVLALFGLLALIFAFWLSAAGPNFHEEGTYLIFIFGLFIAGSIFASMSFNVLGSRDKGIYWLAIPATHLEKLICTIFYTTILFTLVYCLCFYITKTLAISFLHGYIQKHPGSVYIEMKDFEHGFGAAIKYLIYAYFAVQALYLLGSVYFSRYSFVITTVVTAVIIFAFGYYVSRIEDTLHGNWDLVELTKYNAGSNNADLIYKFSPIVTDVLKYIFQFAWAPLFWVITWFRLKEKEI